MDDIEKHTCVRFIDRTNETDFVFIYSGSGCSSNLGKIGNQQRVSLKKKSCFRRGTIIHELIHALGYKHMHSHYDRNNYIDIKWNNIRQNAVRNFERVDLENFSDFGTKYDLYSVMHYHKKAFSENGQITIVPKDPSFQNIIGQRFGLSTGDVQRINNMYNCTV